MFLPPTCLLPLTSSVYDTTFLRLHSEVSRSVSEKCVINSIEMNVNMTVNEDSDWEFRKMIESVGQFPKKMVTNVMTNATTNGEISLK